MKPGRLEATVVFVFTEEGSETQWRLSPQGRLVVKLDLQEILQVHLCYIIHNVPGGAAVKENKNFTNKLTNLSNFIMRKTLIRPGTASSNINTLFYNE